MGNEDAAKNDTATGAAEGASLRTQSKSFVLVRGFVDGSGWAGVYNALRQEEAFAVRQLPEEQGPGNARLLEAKFEQATEIVTGFGKVGVSAESLAKTAAQRMAGFLASEAFAGPYLADQLLLPFALAGGGSFTTVKPSQQARTAADVIERFTGQRWVFDHQPNGSHLVRRA